MAEEWIHKHLHQCGRRRVITRRKGLVLKRTSHHWAHVDDPRTSFGVWMLLTCSNICLTNHGLHNPIVGCDQTPNIGNVYAVDMSHVCFEWVQPGLLSRKIAMTPATRVCYSIIFGTDTRVLHLTSPFCEAPAPRSMTLSIAGSCLCLLWVLAWAIWHPSCTCCCTQSC